MSSQVLVRTLSSVWGPEWKTRWSREELVFRFCLALSWDISFRLLPLDGIWAISFPDSQAFGLNYTTGFPGPPLCRRGIPLHNHVSHSKSPLKIYLYIHTHTYTACVCMYIYLYLEWGWHATLHKKLFCIFW